MAEAATENGVRKATSPEEEHPRKAFGWAARDASGLFSPYAFSRRGMESQNNGPGFGGMHGTSGGEAHDIIHAAAAPPAMQSPPAYNVGVPAPVSWMRLLSYILRISAIVLTLVATIVMGTARGTVTVLFVNPLTGFLSTVAGSTKSTNSAAFVYFIVANTLGSFYSVVSLALLIASKAGKSIMLLPFSIGDLVMVALLFSGNGAATAVSVVLEHGQQRLARWSEICHAVGGFCSRVNAAIVLSTVASLAYVLLVVLGLLGLRKSNF